MRRVPLILGLVLITALMVHDVYEFFVTNNGVHYYLSEPRRLLYVMLLGVAGGVVAFGTSRLSPGSQRKLKLVGLGLFGSFLTGFLIVFAYHVAWLVSMVTKASMWGWVGGTWLCLAVVAGCVWLEFRQVWRHV